MAIYVNKDIQVKVNTVDLTPYVTNVEVVKAVDSVESTSMSATAVNAHTFVGGIQNNVVTITFNQDFAATKVHATLTGLVGTPTTVVVRPTSAVAAAGLNPDFTLTSALMSEYRPIMGAVGDLATVGAIVFTGGTITETTA
jgi:hypothetical protein